MGLLYSRTVKKPLSFPGDRIRERRRAAKMTQHELADKAGVSSGSIGMYETGARTPDIEMVRCLAAILNTSMGYLLGETQDPTPIRVPETALHEAERVYSPHAPIPAETVANLERLVRELSEIVDSAKGPRQRPGGDKKEDKPTEG